MSALAGTVLILAATFPLWIQLFIEQPGEGA